MGGEKNDHLTGFLNIDGLFHMISSVYNGYIYIYMIMKQLWLSEMIVGN